MKTLVPGYYVLEKPIHGLWSEYSRGPFTLLNKVIPFFLKRTIINVALGPDEVRFQAPFHVMFLTDDRTEKGTVIINVLPGKSNQHRKSYFDQVDSNHVDKTYIDSVIAEIGLLLEGKSTRDKCKNKQFAIEDLHIKGIERLDDQLAQFFKEQIREKYNKVFFEHPRKVELDFYSLETPDHAVLESVEVSSREEKAKPLSERKFILTCMARNQNYMYWLKDFYTSAKNIGCTVIGFNYRGIDYSKGMALTHYDMVNDVLSQAARLLETGVKPENIIFEGMSLGAATATIAAAKMHENDLKVTLYNERSYRSLIRLIIGYVMPKSESSLWNPLTWAKYAVVGLAYIFVAPIIWFLGWHINAAGAWKNIPVAYKDYTVARNHQNQGHFDDDDLVHDTYSSIASLMAEQVAEIKQKQTQGELLSTEEQRVLEDKPECHEFTLDRNNKTNSNPSTHSAPRRFLVDTQTQKITMHAYMIEHLRLVLGIKPNSKSVEEETLENTQWRQLKRDSTSHEIQRTLS